ncbi:MAG: cryptochrome/photolyase family protein [Gemmatimonadales bacterium]|nr:cryptochrome/photolyase family protein [Gemmatimonadales bacterium]NIN12966.1 cryptochrome/photolyase family protein [Gemmatimonadales bacterium]NIR02641.1 cryptochrome/photolyase family protein [Gemmatimonadales bacterium]NIS67217.1 cryptochrome/photolyase family protein [Gemmatimonadales bacterium]
MVVLGDQLDMDSRALADFNPSRDAVLMAEVAEEATHVASHVQRTVLFLSAMRHFARSLERKRWRVRYVTLDDPENTHTLTGELVRAARELAPKAIRLAHPGEHRVLQAATQWSRLASVPLEIVPDAHFLTPLDDFRAWVAGRKRPMMEHFYRAQRKRLGILMTPQGTPRGGRWNFDRANRLRFRQRPCARPPLRFAPDEVTRDVIRAVRRRFPDAYGVVEGFGWPVTRRQALRALRDFVEHRLGGFGPYQDAMWSGEPFLNHSLLSPALNLKLLRPGEVVDAALEAGAAGLAPLQSVEGFVRQIIGWREFVRGIYWSQGPGYAGLNALDQHGALPRFYWNGETEMRCLADSIGQVLRYGYGHHIQRLMVTGNFALISGVHPRWISQWYLGMYVDGVDWVTLPNALGMVMHADGGIVGTKPYAASGRYINRMSNYCASCPYDPSQRVGADACPFNTLYWDFLTRNRRRFARNPRMAMMLKNVDRVSAAERRALRTQADRLRVKLGIDAS